MQKKKKNKNFKEDNVKRLSIKVRYIKIYLRLKRSYKSVSEL